MDPDFSFDENDLKDVYSLKACDGSTCLVCFDDLSDQNMVGYKVSRDTGWFLSTFCIECIKYMLKTQYNKYLDNLYNSTCAKEQRALLERGPPINISDKLGFPEAQTSEVYYLYDFRSAKPLSAKLDGSLTGKARQELWDELCNFKFSNDHEE